MRRLFGLLIPWDLGSFSQRIWHIATKCIGSHGSTWHQKDLAFSMIMAECKFSSNEVKCSRQGNRAVLEASCEPQSRIYVHLQQLLNWQPRNVQTIEDCKPNRVHHEGAVHVHNECLIKEIDVGGSQLIDCRNKVGFSPSHGSEYQVQRQVSGSQHSP